MKYLLMFEGIGQIITDSVIADKMSYSESGKVVFYNLREYGEYEFVAAYWRPLRVVKINEEEVKDDN